MTGMSDELTGTATVTCDGCGQTIEYSATGSRGTFAVTLGWALRIHRAATGCTLNPTTGGAP